MLSADTKESYRTTQNGGWVECNGQAISRTTYAGLFGVIGTTFGAGDGSTTFNVPNETPSVNGKTVWIATTNNS